MEKQKKPFWHVKGKDYWKVIADKIDEAKSIDKECSM